MSGSDRGYGHGHGYSYGVGYGEGSGSGSGYSYGDGGGSGYVSGCGYGCGYGYGCSDGYGSGYEGVGEEIGECGGYTATIIDTWGILRIGCELHTLDEWIEKAEEIDAKHGDGIAEKTRELALRLKEERSYGTERC